MDAQPEIPNNPDAEMAVLGSLLIYGAEVFDKGNVVITTDHFYSTEGKTVWRAWRRLVGDAKPCDVVFVTERLRADGSLDVVGGTDFLTRCTRSAPPLAAIEHFVGLLEGTLKQRKLMELGRWTEAVAKDLGTGKDIGDVVAELEQRAFDIGDNRTVQSVTRIAVAEVLEQIATRRDGTFSGGLPTSIPCWDQALGGIFPDRLYTLAARPGLGKTSALEQTVANLLRLNQPVLVFQKDMPRSRFIGRMACRLSNVSFYEFERGWLSPDDLDSVESNVRDIASAPLHLYDPVKLTATDIHTIVRREKRRNGIAAWFLDYVQLLDYSGDDLRVGLTQASMELKRTISDTKVPGVILAQLNRKGADKTKGRPLASDIKEFDQLHADSGVVMLLYTEQDAMALKAGQSLLTKWAIDKNNFGPTSEENCWFDPRTMRFFIEDGEPDLGPDIP